ncbi:MAG TPA: FAD:protein FMN transferase [Microthrixaceae bacterium]|nr:FAD:protein FMN transferase [Microthrixaceae bacterium]
MAMLQHPTDPKVREDRFAEAHGLTMGTRAHIMLYGGGDPELELHRVRRLEHMWSRFIDGSELSRVGRLDGAPVIVSRETAMLLERSVEAWRRTAGLFDATMLEHLEALGYDRSFDLLDSVDLNSIDSCGVNGKVDGSQRVAAPGPETRTETGTLNSEAISNSANLLIEADVMTGQVKVPAGVRVDPGGIGKGLAADLVAIEAIRDGSEGALVSIGGDMRAAGIPPDQGWEIVLDHHVADLARINIRNGAVATSTRLRRRWRTTAGVAHHVVDPRTHLPSTGPAVAVSVLASEAWWAEAVATAVLVGFGTPGFDELADLLLENVGALITTADRCSHRLGPLGSAFLVSRGSSKGRAAAVHPDNGEDVT